MNGEELLQDIREVMHIPEMQNFKNGQYETIQAIMQGKDALVIMPTGNGKSLYSH